MHILLFYVIIRSPPIFIESMRQWDILLLRKQGIGLKKDNMMR